MQSHPSITSLQIFYVCKMHNWYMFVISAWTTITTTFNNNNNQSQSHENCSVAIREIACIKSAITAQQQFFLFLLLLFHIVTCCCCYCLHIYMQCMQLSHCMSPRCRRMRSPQNVPGTHDFHNKHSKTQKSKKCDPQKRRDRVRAVRLATCENKST